MAEDHMKQPVGRLAVLKTAARIVTQEGLAGLTMGRLVQETGVSRATLYRQVGGRDALLNALTATGVDVGDRTGPRARILLAAREVFGRVGFEAATLDEIATAANVGVVTIYRHFGDKDGLVAAFLDDLAPRRAVFEARGSSSADVRADLERLAERVLIGMRDETALVRLLILETLRGSEMLTRIRAKAPTRMPSALAALIAGHQAGGRLRADLDVRTLAQAFAGMVLAFGVVAPILRGEPPADPVQTAKAITELFLTGAWERRR
jgi:AcrR family transcriptional regulator